MTDQMQVGRIEQLTFTDKDRNRDFVVVSNTDKQLAADKWLDAQIALEKPTRTILPNFPQGLKFNADRSLSLDAISDWLVTIPVAALEMEVLSVIFHLYQNGSHSQATMVFGRYTQHILNYQFQVDCEAECTACGKPDKYYPAVWDEEANNYQHETIKKGKGDEHGKMETCDATLLFMFWSDSHKDK